MSSIFALVRFFFLFHFYRHFLSFESKVVSKWRGMHGDFRKYLLMYFWRKTETAARMTNVTKSPNDDANGHAILSTNMTEKRQESSLSDLISMQQIRPSPKIHIEFFTNS